MPILPSVISEKQSENLKTAIYLLMVLANPINAKIISQIAASPEISVGDICRRLSLAQGTVSYKLMFLRHAKLVIVKQDGVKRLYSVNEKRLKQIISVTEKLIA